MWLHLIDTLVFLDIFCDQHKSADFDAEKSVFFCQSLARPLLGEGVVHASLSQGHTIHTPVHTPTKGQSRVINPAMKHVFEQWEEAGVPGQNPHMHNCATMEPLVYGDYTTTLL